MQITILLQLLLLMLQKIERVRRSLIYFHTIFLTIFLSPIRQLHHVLR